MKKKIDTLITFIFKIIFRTKHKILIIEDSYPSGSNTAILYNKIQVENKYEVEYFNSKNENINKYKKYLLKKYLLATSKIIIGTHGIQKIKKNQILINLWHGIPLKSMNYMEEKTEKYKAFTDDYLITNSKFESLLLTSTMFIPFKNHVLTGSPRLDYFLDQKNNILLNNLKRKYTKIIIYLPTFRNGFMDRTEGKFNGNLFNFKKLNYDRLTYYLKEHNILLMVKYHQSEKNKINFNLDNLENVLSLTDDFFISQKIDLYELLPYTDLLITDYSSVYLDYLLLNKPIIFTPTDLEEYSIDRGLLLEPYEEWTPGPKVVNQKQLEEAVKDSFSNDSYILARKEIMKKVFGKRNLDGKNTDRLIKLIDTIY